MSSNSSSTQYIVDYSNNPEAQLKENQQLYCLYLKPADREFGSLDPQGAFGFFPDSLYIFVEAFHPKYKEVYEFLIKIAEPVNKPNFIHLYKITLFSMYTAMSLNLNAEKIIKSLKEYSKNLVIPKSFESFIANSTVKAGSAYLYMINKNYYLKIHQHFLEQAISIHREPYCNIIRLEENPPVSLTKLQDENKQWAFKYYKILDKTRLFEITETIIKQGISLINEYFDDRIVDADPNNPNPSINPNKKLDIELKQITQPRIYQQKALKNIFVSEKPRSATIVLPCGAGKTLLGIIVTEKIKGYTLVICDIDTATKQWKNEFLRWTTVKADRIKIQTGKTKNIEKQDSKPFILITTFKQLASIIKKNKDNKNSNTMVDQSKYSYSAEQFIQDLEWDLCIADETQYSAAQTYKKIFEEFNFKLKIGLTATPYREDNKIDDLFHVIGPKLYEANISELIQDSYLAKPYCVVFRVDMHQKALSNKNNVVYYSGNPNKFQLLYYLIKLHEARHDKILVFCDQISVLKFFSQKMGYPAIYGDVQLLEKLVWLELFRKGEINTLFLSRVGDTALDLPIANVCIQIGFQYGSRRQEVQRLGRIMRRKEGQKGEFNAFFYTIVSKNTDQTHFYYRRQKSLMDLGINFEVIDVDQSNFKYDPDIFDANIKKVQKEVEEDLTYLNKDFADRQNAEDEN